MGETSRTLRERFRTTPRPGPSDPNEIGLAILAASADGVVAIDDHGTVRFSNQAAVQLLGQPVDEGLGALHAHRLVHRIQGEVRAQTSARLLPTLIVTGFHQPGHGHDRRV